ncbi:MAG: FmdB family zinc ribbon protein [Sphaerochaetaceae bacterium]|jgi:putative FmdB family regulatory protein
MPIYEYECDFCKNHFEIEQSMRDEPLSECPVCKAEIRRIFGLSSIIFKGSGFYINDSKPQKEAKSETSSS